MADKQHLEGDRDRARREPIFEDADWPDLNRAELADRDAIGDDFSSNRGMDASKDTLAQVPQKRMEAYTRSKATNIDQVINQGNI